MATELSAGSAVVAGLGSWSFRALIVVLHLLDFTLEDTHGLTEASRKTGKLGCAEQEQNDSNDDYQVPTIEILQHHNFFRVRAVLLAYALRGCLALADSRGKRNTLHPRRDRADSLYWFKDSDDAWIQRHKTRHAADITKPDAHTNLI